MGHAVHARGSGGGGATRTCHVLPCTGHMCLSALRATARPTALHPLAAVYTRTHARTPWLACAGLASSAAALLLMPMAWGMASGVGMTTLTLGALGFSRGGFSVNHMDVAPKYAGAIMGISNTAGGRKGGGRQGA